MAEMAAAAEAQVEMAVMAEAQAGVAVLTAHRVRKYAGRAQPHWRQGATLGTNSQMVCVQAKRTWLWSAGSPHTFSCLPTATHCLKHCEGCPIRLLCPHTAEAVAGEMVGAMGVMRVAERAAAGRAATA